MQAEEQSYGLSAVDFDGDDIEGFASYDTETEYNGVVDLSQVVDHSGSLEDQCVQYQNVCGDVYNSVASVRECMPVSCQSWMVEQTGNLDYVTMAPPGMSCNDQSLHYAQAGFLRAEMDNGLLTEGCPTMEQVISASDYDQPVEGMAQAYSATVGF